MNTLVTILFSISAIMFALSIFSMFPSGLVDSEKSFYKTGARRAIIGTISLCIGTCMVFGFIGLAISGAIGTLYSSYCFYQYCHAL